MDGQNSYKHLITIRMCYDDDDKDDGMDILITAEVNLMCYNYTQGSNQVQVSIITKFDLVMHPHKFRAMVRILSNVLVLHSWHYINEKNEFSTIFKSYYSIRPIRKLFQPNGLFSTALPTRQRNFFRGWEILTRAVLN